MKNSTKAKTGRTLLLLVCLLVWTGCAPVTIKTTVLEPGRFDQAAYLKKVAVVPFDGPQGKEFASELEGTLASINVNEKPYFEVVDRASIDKTMNEMKLSMTGMVDPATAAKVGNLVGAQGIYTGTITSSSVIDAKYQETRTRCAYEVTKTDKKGNQYQECGRYEDYPVSCTKRVATFAVTPKLIEVETGKIIYSNTLEKSLTAKGCADRKPLPDAAEMRRKVQDSVKAEFRSDIAPHYVTEQISLMDLTSDVGSAQAAQKVKAGVDFAKHDRLDRSCALWEEAKKLSPKSITLLYNLGVCAEVSNRLDDALSLYKEADKGLNKPDDRVSAALSRVTEAIQMQKKLSQQVSP